MNDLLVKKRLVRKNGAVPIYVQLAEILDEEVQLRRGAPFALPSEGDLSRQFDVSRVTVRQALKQLESRGVIYSEHGRGYFNTTTRMQGVSGFHSFTSEVRRLGGTPSSDVIIFEHVPDLPPSFRQHIALVDTSDHRFIYMKRVRSIDGDPVAVEDAYIPAELFPTMTREMFQTGSLYEEMTATSGLVPAWTDALFEPCAATAEEAEHLRIKTEAPVLTVWRVTMTDTDRPVEYVKSVYKGGGFMLNVNRYRL